MDTAHPAPLVGNRYQLLNPLGEGGMGIVFRALDRLTGQEVALKRVTIMGEAIQFESTGAGLDFRLALAQEFRTLASLRHPHIISVLDYGFDDAQQPYFTMELLHEPKTLLEAAHDTDLYTRITLLVRMLQALAYLHRRNIIHSDLKPENVLVVGSDSHVKILDFGLAAPLGQVRGMVGSLPYMAPEVLRNQPITKAADLYAVGVMAYQLFSGQHPFQLSDTSRLLRHIVETVPDLRVIEARMSSPHLAQIVGRLLAKDPLDRYADVQSVMADLCTAVERPIPGESVEIRESYLQAAQFVGRENLLNQLTTALDGALAGKGSAWLVGGESGMGKSRLLDELRIQALVKGVTVLTGQADEQRAQPYHIWRAVIRRLALSTGISAVEAGILKQIVPDIEQVIGHPVPDVPELDAEAGQRRLVQTITALFRRQQAPTLLLLEDLQWTQDGLETLRHLSALAPELPLMIVGTYRSDDAPYLYGQLPDMTLMTLERLSETEIEALSRSMLGNIEQHPELLALLRNQTDGNALFIVEVVRALAEEAGRLDQIGAEPLPPSVIAKGIAEVVQRRLSRLPHGMMPTLQLAAVMGREIDLNLLDYLLGDEDYVDWLWACAEASLLEVSDNRWRFAHDQVRETVLQGMSSDETSKLHRRVAEALEALYPDDPTQVVPLYQHWRAAGDNARSRAYALKAGRFASRIDQQGAIRHLNDALALSEPLDLKARAGLLVEIAEAHIAMSDFATALPCLERADQFADVIQCRTIQADVLYNHGWMAMERAQYDAAAPNLRQSLDIVLELGDKTREARILLQLGMMHARTGALDDGEALFQQALRLAQELQDRWIEARALGNLAIIAHYRNQFDTAESTWQELITVATELGNQEGVAAAYGNLSVMMFFQQRYEEAASNAKESLRVSREIGDRWQTANQLNLLGYIYAQTGHDDAARDMLRQALREAVAIEATSLILDVLCGFAQLRLKHGHLEQACEILGLALNHPSANVDVQQTAQPILDKLRAMLPPEAIDTAMARGAKRALASVVEQILSDELVVW